MTAGQNAARNSARARVLVADRPREPAVANALSAPPSAATTTTPSPTSAVTRDERAEAGRAASRGRHGSSAKSANTVRYSSARLAPSHASPRAVAHAIDGSSTA